MKTGRENEIQKWILWLKPHRPCAIISFILRTRKQFPDRKQLFLNFDQKILHSVSGEMVRQKISMDTLVLRLRHVHEYWLHIVKIFRFTWCANIIHHTLFSFKRTFVQLSKKKKEENLHLTKVFFFGEERMDVVSEFETGAC